MWLLENIVLYVVDVHVYWIVLSETKMENTGKHP